MSDLSGSGYAFYKKSAYREGRYVHPVLGNQWGYHLQLSQGTDCYNMPIWRSDGTEWSCFQ